MKGPLILLVVVVALAVFAAGLGAYLYLDQQAERQVATGQESCDRGNLVRGYLLLRAREFQQADDRTGARTTELAPDVFPVLDCFARHPVTLSAAAQEEYLRVLNAGRWPVVRRGRVIATKQLPGD